MFERFGGFMTTLIWLLPLPPLLSFFAILLFTNKRKALSHGIAIGAAGLSWLGTMIIFIRAVGVEEFGKHIFWLIHQLVTDRVKLVEGRRANRPTFGCRGFLRCLDRVGNLCLQHWIPQLWPTER